MKRLDRLILRSYIGPLILTFTLSVFVLLMQFVWKYIDDMVGKGLDFGVIMELLLYASATFVPMALPIAVLFASIMTMGNFGENYELVAMKAGGISVWRVMMPLAMVSLLLSGVAFYFSNNVMPVAMLKYKTTLYDITHKKPAVNIRPSQYYGEIEGYVIRVNSKEADDRTLHDIIIYDHSQGMSRTNVIMANHGTMQTTPDDRYLLFTLYDGYTYSEVSDGEEYFSRPLTRIGFKKQTLSFDISSFAFAKSGDDLYGGNYQVMNVGQLNSAIDTLTKDLLSRTSEYTDVLVHKLSTYRLYQGRMDSIEHSATKTVSELIAGVGPDERSAIYRQAYNLASQAMMEVDMYKENVESDATYINRHYVVLHRKFTLSLACLLLFFVGASFGSIVRKGGLGMPLVASVLFFVMYYVIDMMGEKAVREGAVGAIGMWYSTMVYIPIAILLTAQATSEVAFFDGALWRSRWKKARKSLRKVLRKRA